MISNASYGPYFTHRLGHGLGLEIHEHPYLNGANHEILKGGEVVTNEPVIGPLSFGPLSFIPLSSTLSIFRVLSLYLPFFHKALINLRGYT